MNIFTKKTGKYFIKRPVHIIQQTGTLFLLKRPVHFFIKRPVHILEDRYMYGIVS